MAKLKQEDVLQYVEKHIGEFHQKRIASLDNLKLKTVLKKKNPYLFRAKYMLTSEQIVRGLTDAFISSNEETIFGDWLEGLAIFVNNKSFSGRKSGISGIDLEFDRDDTRYIVTIKSGPNWGNSRQIEKMETDFQTAIRTLRTSGAKIHIIAVNGCCYGKDNKDKGLYLKYCGQKFWEFISGDEELYTKIIEPLGHKAREKNDDFMKSYARMVNKFTQEFSKDFCNNDGEIDWVSLVRFNSGK
ncbi:MAG TPA: PmeII family type II restriction endonuclease [Candidatus Kapabacteria bacterium]|nr:PmeII family type II restriction endonuclease [Candidatus Kapabacteria bacterium]